MSTQSSEFYSSFEFDSGKSSVTSYEMDYPKNTASALEKLLSELKKHENSGMFTEKIKVVLTPSEVSCLIDVIQPIVLRNQIGINLPEDFKIPYL